MTASFFRATKHIERHVAAAAPSAAGFRRPVAHVLFEAPEAWTVEALRARYQSWFWGDAATWRDAYDADDERLFVELDGFMFICRSVVESWTTDRISREVGGGLGGSFAAALGDSVRARVTISPDASMSQWVGAPQSDRRGAMDALFKLVAANAALEGATATIWPVARSVVSAQDTAAAALAPQPQTPWARILRVDAGPHAGSQRVSARSAGLAQVAGFELTLAPAPAYSARRLMAVASELLDHIAGSAPAMPDGPYALPSGRVCRLSRSFDRTSNAVEVRVEI